MFLIKTFLKELPVKFFSQKNKNIIRTSDLKKKLNIF